MTLNGSTFRFMLAALAMTILVAGCSTEPPVAPSNPVFNQGLLTTAGTEQGAGTQDRAMVLSVNETSCNTSSGLLWPDAMLSLPLFNSEVAYPPGAVSLPTLVDFSICDLDTTGLNGLAPKVATFGPDLLQIFRRPIQVKMKGTDYGLNSEDIGEGAKYHLFRLDEQGLGWEYVLSNEFIDQYCVHEVSQNGSYAIALVSSTIGDSSWTTRGFISPLTGGTIQVRNSTLSVPVGAVPDTMTMSFTLSYEVPANVPNALERVYEFGPEGTTFLSPVTLTIDLEDSGYESPDDQTLYLYYFVESENAWVRQQNPVLLRNDAIVVDLHHFSRYAFGR